MDAKEILMSNNFWVLNKRIVKEYGVETALLLSVFAEADKMLSDEEGWFFQTAETIEKLTGMSNHIQTKAINKLKSLGIIKQKNQGIPMKRYFKINYKKIESQVFKNFKNYNSKKLKTSIQKNSKYKENNNKENKYKKNNIYNGDQINLSRIKYFIDYFNKIFETTISYNNQKLNEQIENNLNETDITDEEDIRIIINTYFNYNFTKDIDKTIWHLIDNQIFKGMCFEAQLIDGNYAYGIDGNGY